MKLVIDSNIVISALIASKGKTRELIQHPSLELYAPERLESEINKHKELIKEKIGYRGGNPEALDPLLARIYNQINVVPKKEYESNLEKSKDTLDDPKDAPFLALALRLNCGIWSDEKHLNNQKQVRTYRTHELAKEAPEILEF